VITQALSDDFDSVFGKAFARAYEEAIEKLEADDSFNADRGTS
jgi:predicted component of type VI protein secretion system